MKRKNSFTNKRNKKNHDIQIILKTMTSQDLYHELSYYTLAHTSPNFIHQHIVDAYGAQSADLNTKPITIFFALVWLYLLIEKNYTGKQIQEAHMKLAKQTKEYPTLIIPQEKGKITVKDVLETSAGKQRDIMIHKWCTSIWESFSSQHQVIQDTTHKFLYI